MLAGGTRMQTSPPSNDYNLMFNNSHWNGRINGKEEPEKDSLLLLIIFFFFKSQDYLGIT